MESTKKSLITVETTVEASIEKVWEYWTTPEHIRRWNNASETWHTPKVENDLKPGGGFNYRMEAKDKSFGFDFSGIYDEVKINEYIAYTLGDGREVEITFSGDGKETKITERFQSEGTNPEEMQRQGWQAILDNFKKYTESTR